MIQLPQIVSVDSYRSPDGQVEPDAVARTAAGGTWVVEVKWGGRQAGRQEMERLMAKAEAGQLPADVTFWYVSTSGFSQEARNYAAKHGISLTDRAGFETLARMANR